MVSRAVGAVGAAISAVAGAVMPSMFKASKSAAELAAADTESYAEPGLSEHKAGWGWGLPAGLGRGGRAAVRAARRPPRVGAGPTCRRCACPDPDPPCLPCPLPLPPGQEAPRGVLAPRVRGAAPRGARLQRGGLDKRGRGAVGGAACLQRLHACSGSCCLHAPASRQGRRTPHSLHTSAAAPPGPPAGGAAPARAGAAQQGAWEEQAGAALRTGCLQQAWPVVLAPAALASSGLAACWLLALCQIWVGRREPAA